MAGLSDTLRYLLARYILSDPKPFSRNAVKWARWHGIPQRQKWWRKLR